MEAPISLRSFKIYSFLFSFTIDIEYNTERYPPSLCNVVAKTHLYKCLFSSFSIFQLFNNKVLGSICQSLQQLLFLFFYFCRYIATFIYHAFYCIAIAQVRIILEKVLNRKRRKQDVDKYLLPRDCLTSHWALNREECKVRIQSGITELGFSPSLFSLLFLLLVDIFTAYDLVYDPVENVKNEED